MATHTPVSHGHLTSSPTEHPAASSSAQPKHHSPEGPAGTAAHAREPSPPRMFQHISSNPVGLQMKCRSFIESLQDDQALPPPRQPEAELGCLQPAGESQLQSHSGSRAGQATTAVTSSYSQSTLLLHACSTAFSIWDRTRLGTGRLYRCCGASGLPEDVADRGWGYAHNAGHS